VRGDGGTRVRRGPIDWLEARFNLTEIVAFLATFGLFPAEIDIRLPLRQALAEALARPLPSYARWPRVLGLVSFLLFLFLGLTGGLLAFYYQPTSEQAYLSVTAIARDVNFGWFVHQTHRWAANLFVLVLLVRLARFFVQGTYKAPREAIWVLAALAYLVALHADLTGRLLPWDSHGYWTSVRAIEILDALPVAGPLLSFLVGGTGADTLVLTRFFFLHVAIQPAILLLLFYLHFAGVRRVGLSLVGRETGRPGVTVRVQVHNLLILVVLVLGALVTLATLFPAPFGPPADPASTPPGARPPWYLLASHALLESAPSVIPPFARGLLLVLLLAVFVFLPFLDRSAATAPRQRRAALAAGAVVLVVWILMTWRGYLLEAGP
jgi:quinol-cytochrome oxidoreductase complex cytochrome b subunit